jgi:hypothetical protein
VKAGWYARRLMAMSPAEVAHRVRHQAVKKAWRRSWTPDGSVAPAVAAAGAVFRGQLPPFDEQGVDPAALKSLVARADEILAGSFEVLGVVREDLVAPDWFRDPITGRRAPDRSYAFSIPYRDEDQVGTIKQIWELSRHHHLTVLAAAYHLTGDEVYARRVEEHLRDWWAVNPFLTGVHWTSGIELGIRLISWTWVRRLLDAWAPVVDLFERNPVFHAQLDAHHRYLAALVSTGSSANNHVIAEAAGQFVAATAFPWLPSSERWAADALELLKDELAAQTFPSGLNRELASDYHGLVLELALVAAAELVCASQAVPAGLADPIVRMTDALAAIVDVRFQPPRQGDGDDGVGLVVDGSDANRWASLLMTGAEAVGGRPWWPSLPGVDVRAQLLGAVLRGRLEAQRPRPATRPSVLGDAGMVIVRGRTSEGQEIWCRGDAGPHGFLSIAAHAHADALAIELRVDGVEVVADPGTYCYHGEPAWRTYFRGTAGHATLEIDGRDQSESGGPFLWTRHANTWLLETVGLDDAPLARWVAEHDGYSRRDEPVRHRRRVELDRETSRLTIVDELVDEPVDGSSHPVRLSLPLGPDVTCRLEGHTAELHWPGSERGATLHLDPALTWQVVRGQEDPPRGWYSPGFGTKVPAPLLAGTGVLAPGQALRCSFQL